MDSIEWDEARLRGIDLAKLRNEAFSTLDHYRIVSRVEATREVYWRYKQFDALAKYRPKARMSRKRRVDVLPVIMNSIQKKAVSIFFTETQLRIADEAQNKDEK